MASYTGTSALRLSGVTGTTRLTGALLSSTGVSGGAPQVIEAQNAVARKFEDFRGSMTIWDRIFTQKATGKAARAMVTEAVKAHYAAKLEDMMFGLNLALAEAKQIRLLDHQHRVAEITRHVGQATADAAAAVSEETMQSLLDCYKWSHGSMQEIEAQRARGTISAEGEADAKRALAVITARRSEAVSNVFDGLIDGQIAKLHAALSPRDTKGA